MSTDEHSRLAVVTGAGSGIGRATAAQLASSSYVVLGLDLTDPPPELAANERVHWIAGDVVDAATWRRAQALSLELDPLGADCLVACAGTVTPSPLLETSLEQFRRHFDINVLGVVQGMQALMPRMCERGRGSVAVVCSIASLFVEDSASAYCASKAALLQVVRSAALEYASAGLRVNAVCPGIVDTPLLRSFIDVLDDPEPVYGDMERRTPTGKILRPEEVAEVLCFLVSDGASGMSGATLTIDGGLTTTYDFDSSSR